LQITSFRLASTQRTFDRTEQKWVDAETERLQRHARGALVSNALGHRQQRGTPDAVRAVTVPTWIQRQQSF
jgi:hypothetical protein